MIDRFLKASIRLQFIVFASIPVPAIVICIIAILPAPIIFQNEKLLMARGAQVELLVTQFRNAGNESAVESLVRSTAPLGLELKVLSWGDVSGEEDRQSDDHFLSDELRSVLPANFEAVVLEDTQGGEGHSTIAVRLDRLRALVIGFSGADIAPSAISAIAEFIAKVILLMLPMLLLVLYIGTMITSPLVRFADAAKSIRLDGDEEELFAADGAKEIRTLATSLNNMRRRIRKMVDDRTRMLTAVSHDLRTPLTRLRMRVERSKDAASKEAMLADISTLTTMIEDSLQYLTSTATVEPPRKVDISSLLQTIASEFSDLGYNVVYSGLDRFAYICKRKALVRAVTNVVENGTRFGTKVGIELRTNSRGDVKIVVSDNGPGLEGDLHERVLEPFFKADKARTTGAHGGFGLGLSIADEIVKGHGGSLILENSSPTGLRVTIRLPSTQIIARQTAITSTAIGNALAQDVLAEEE